MKTAPLMDSSRLIYVQVVFGLFVLFYAACLLYHPAFGIVDDHLFLQTVCVGKMLPLAIDPSQARFFPLDGQELSILGRFTPSPFWFYFFNAVELFLAAWLLIKITQEAIAKRRSSLPYVLTFFVFLTPAFVNGWFRLYVPERDEFLFLGLFFLCYLLFQKRQTYELYLAGCIFAVIALFYKETAFLIVGGIGFFHMALGRETINRRQKYFDVFSIVASVLWLLIYCFVIYMHRGAHLYGARPKDSFVLSFLKTVVAFFLIDPVIAVCGTALVSVRIWQIAVQRKLIDLMPDSILFSSYLFFVAYLLLHQHADYHMLPLYVFVPYLIAKYIPVGEVSRKFKIAIVLVLVLVCNQTLYGLRQISFWKSTPINFQSVLSVLSSQINESPGRVNIFLAGTNRVSGGELYASLPKYLEFKGISPDRFDLRSDTAVDEPLLFTPDPSSPFSYQRSAVVDQFAKGDYILLLPGNALNRQAEFQNTGMYKMIYKTNSSYFPDLNLRRFVKIWTMRTTSRAHLSDDGGSDTNFYLYKKIAD